MIFKGPKQNGEPWSLSEQATELPHALRQRVCILQFLRRPPFKLSLQILSFIFKSWLGGLVHYFNPILTVIRTLNLGSTLEMAHTIALRTAWDLPQSSPVASSTGQPGTSRYAINETFWHGLGGTRSRAPSVPSDSQGILELDRLRSTLPLPKHVLCA